MRIRMNTSSSSSGGIGFLGLLTIVFVTLKLMGYITWSWWWVSFPIWGPIAIVSLLLGACGIGWAILESKKQTR